MQDITLAIPGHELSYHIIVGSNLLLRANEFLQTDKYSKIFVITDEHVADQWLPKLQQVLAKIDGSLIVPAGESAKQLPNVERIWTAMHEAGCDRKSLVIILGGGVVGDIAAFAASTYMRGVAFAQIPTTLVAQVDSSVGGKTGFDFNELKNFIGTFAQPTAVLIDTGTLATLPPRELIAGFAEMYKHGLIQDAGYFDKLAQKLPLQYSADELADLISASIHIKADIVARDERETGERKLVNFGHTVGHAIEALSWNTDNPLLHGEAIAIGMAIEADLSVQIGYISANDAQRIKQILSAAGLPVFAPHYPMDQLFAKMRDDKKNENQVIMFTLLAQIGHAVYNQSLDDAVIATTITSNMEP